MAAMRFVGNGQSLARRVHVQDDGAGYVIELALPDFGPDDLRVETLGRVVTVRGEQKEDGSDRDLPFRLNERLVEAFRLPEDACADEIVASYKHGTLELRVPRMQLEARRVEIATADVGRVHADVAPI